MLVIEILLGLVAGWSFATWAHLLYRIRFAARMFADSDPRFGVFMVCAAQVILALGFLGLLLK
jgi:hypothetical protein